MWLWKFTDSWTMSQIISLNTWKWLLGLIQNHQIDNENYSSVKKLICESLFPMFQKINNKKIIEFLLVNIVNFSRL